MLEGNKTALGTLFHRARMSKGISQKEIANKLGYSNAQFVSNWERGVSTCPIDKIPKLISILGMDKDKTVQKISSIVARDIKERLQ